MACVHQFESCAEHADYGRCLACGTYRSLTAPPSEQVYTADYWSHARNHSTIVEQIWNCQSYLENGVNKNDFLLRQVDCGQHKAALEIGCAPGSMLRRLRKDLDFKAVVGIEMCQEWNSQIREVLGDLTNIFLRFGKFPDCMKEWIASYDLIIASDVFEHSHEPEAFLAECARLLKPGGQLILMLPLLGFGELPERMWNAEEHVFLHHQSNLGMMLADAGFHNLRAGKWCPGHDTISARRVV